MVVVINEGKLQAGPTDGPAALEEGAARPPTHTVAAGGSRRTNSSISMDAAVSSNGTTKSTSPTEVKAVLAHDGELA